MLASEEEDQKESLSPEILGEDLGPTLTPRSIRKRRLIIWKNVCLISISFSVTFMAFQSLQSLQSSLNAADGMGVAALSVTYGVAILTNILFTSMIISKKGCKWTLVLSTFAYMGFALAHLYPSWYTLIPGAALVGVAAGPLWAAKCTYLSSSAIEYSKIIGKDKGPVVTHFFGVFSAIFQIGSILGSVLMSVILKPAFKCVSVATTKGGKSSAESNSTLTSTRYCGREDCPSQIKKLTNGTLNNVADQQSVVLLMSIFSGAIFLSGVFIMVFVDNIRPDEDETKLPIKSHIFATLKMSFKERRMLFLLPVHTYAALLPGFIAVDFSKSYVTCSLGISSLGFVLMGMLAAQVAFSLVIGRVEMFTGRKAIMVAAYVISVTIFVFLLMWDTEQFPNFVLYAIACVFGLVKCIWKTESNSYTGVLFPNDLKTAYAVVRICMSFGFLVSFAWGYHLCVYVKIYIHLAFQSLAIACYFVTEYLDSQKRKKELAQDAVELAEMKT